LLVISISDGNNAPNQTLLGSFFTGSPTFTVREIDVFEIHRANCTPPFSLHMSGARRDSQQTSAIISLLQMQQRQSTASGHAAPTLASGTTSLIEVSFASELHSQQWTVSAYLRLSE
jgi:hypothetical protein